MIGRSVVVRHRVRGSLLPLWIWIALLVVSLVLSVVVVGIALSSAFSPLLSSLGSLSS